MDRLRSSKLELELEVQERTAALRERVEDLARSNRELEQFAYVSSHDLQEPLRVISGYIGLLQQRSRGKLDLESEQFMEQAIQAAARLQAMIRDLLAYARLGSMPTPATTVDAEGAFQTAVENLDRAIADASATITHDPLPLVLAEDGQIVQVFQNLIANAIKFRSANPPRVHVSAKRVGDDWEFSIKDNGIGMDPKYQDRVFVIFQRLHGRDRYPGTGIGLAICKKIVERHGGRIWYESEGEGRGTTFHFTIPFREVSAPTQSVEPSTREPETLQRRIGRVV
jgi:light-regulated signal transduction histidine kinase (bacteriophytochrome)